ncbi:serine/threonine-protein kinase [Protofrankia symbiont of Coriaria ruscifolia]|uniref:serine/threonine-protein kinase n=1 Tax=Protofrankia symbiont of Coriaria ruscifolia TaxID=1306542 RepID=UPI001F5F73F1|nr:serine/threonine-protein kinase [Protofrankia symbiont of Coriaria ruscifolia]
MLRTGGTPATRRLGSRYILHQPLGKGASGEVWRGERVDDGTGDRGMVAVKILRPEVSDDPEIVDRFLRERRVLLAFDDLHLVKVRDIVAEGDTLAIVMDLVDGVDLRGYLRERGRLPTADAVELVGQVLSALTVVHEAGVVHRDVKPANILIDTTGPGPARAMLTDFGIARLTQTPSMTRLSVTIGTPMYMAPELAEHTPAGPAADIYGAGVRPDRRRLVDPAAGSIRGRTGVRTDVPRAPRRRLVPGRAASRPAPGADRAVLRAPHRPHRRGASA